MITAHQQLDSELVRWAVRNGYGDRIIALDLETKVLDGHFLNNETILSASIARRIGDVVAEVLVLKEDSPTAELELLRQLDEHLLKIRPMIVVGFNHRGYDNILLSAKKKHLGKVGYWGIKDMLEMAQMIDIMHAARFAISEHDGLSPKILSLSKVLQHSMFAELPLKRTKSLISGDTDKGLQIYNLWKNDKQTFLRYAEGDVHDTYLIFEELFRN